MSPSGVITPADIFEKFGRHVSSPYVAFLRRMGLHQVFVRARQALVYDSEGREYIDCIAGYGNLNLGHNPPAIIKAVVEEIRSPRPFNWPFVSDAHASLAERLANCFPGKLDCCLVVNSGAEAVDSALKLVRLATRKTKVISMNGAWHGFTFGALSISEASMCRCFQPLLEGITHVPYGDARAVEQAIDPETGAVFVEPIQAESGAVVPPPGYLQELAEVWLENKEGKRVGPGVVGELVVRGRHVMRGYWEAPELTASRYRPGPLPGERLCYTGDLFRMDEDGCMYFVGRKDDIIKSRGEKVAPKEVETVIYGLAGVVEVIVLGVPDPILGQAVKAVIVKDGSPLTASNVLAHCKANLEDFMVPKYVEFRDELPKSPSGKVKRGAL